MIVLAFGGRVTERSSSRLRRQDHENFTGRAFGGRYRLPYFIWRGIYLASQKKEPLEPAVRAVLENAQGPAYAQSRN